MNKLIAEIETRIAELYNSRIKSFDFNDKNFLSAQEYQLEWVLKKLQSLRSSTDRT